MRGWWAAPSGPRTHVTRSQDRTEPRTHSQVKRRKLGRREEVTTVGRPWIGRDEVLQRWA